MKTLLPFFYPTQVILIDDNYQTLQGLKNSLGQGMITCKAFDNPFTALEYINDVSNNLPSQHAAQTGKSLLDGNMESFYEEIYSPTRFQQISIIITDYDMPGMNGLELCQNVTSQHIQKIILTGAATEKVAVEAFNAKTIDYFIQKNDAEVIQKLKDLIYQCQEKYFRSITHNLLNIISYENAPGLNIDDPIFIEFFQKLLKDKKICEYYLLDVYGNTLFLTADGKVSALFVFDQRLLIGQEELIPGTKITEELVQEFLNNKKAICHYDFKDHPAYNPTDWETLLYPLFPLEGIENYFWAYVDSIPYLKKDGIISFKGYKESLFDK